MKIAIVSHLVLDSIQDASGNVFKSLGGPASYCSLIARRFNFDVSLVTKVGADFPQQYKRLLLAEKITIGEAQLSYSLPTTKFQLILGRGERLNSRSLFLSARGAPLSTADLENINTDYWLVSPVLDEVPEPVLRAAISRCGKNGFVMIDPQGYTRSVDAVGSIVSVDNVTLDLSGASAIKADQTELKTLTNGLIGVQAMQYLQSHVGIKFVISTEYSRIHLVCNGIHYWIDFEENDYPDSTGVGDILSSAFCCSYIREKDPLWAISFGAGAIRAALETRHIGLDKVPSRTLIEESASYFYNSINFQRL
jgi:sugar/nucleoside kinase (ribokinase family)